MLKKPFFSIVIPTYNRAADLQFALFCIFRQTFSDFEVVISDNCSTDNTEIVVKRFNNKKIRYSRTKETVGNALNIKRVIGQAKGKYVFLHSDDDFIVYQNSLQEMYNKIKGENPGYIRINYASLSLDKKRIFYYRFAKPFEEDKYFSPHLSNKKILSIILESDPYFISGLIFKNTIPKNVGLIDSDPLSCIELFFYIIRKHGASFIVKPHIIASWSRRTLKKNAKHHFYILLDGKLRYENYLEAVKKKVDRETYEKFLHRELTHLGVILFGGMKSDVGAKRTIQIASRIFSLDKAMRKSILFWVSIIVAVLLPGKVLVLMRWLFIDLVSRISKINGEKQVVKTIKQLESEYMRSKAKMHRVEPIFNFT